MKAKLLIGLVGLFITVSTQAKSNIDQPSIEVVGTATTEVIPDIMRWGLTIENKGKDLKIVASTHAATVAKLLTTLKSFKIDEERIKTSNMTFGENWEYTDRVRTKLGYKASTTILFSINKFDQYKSIWLKLSSINTVSVESIDYDYSKRAEVENQTRKEALKMAITKANSLVSVLKGSTLGEPLLIKEGYNPNYHNEDLEDDGFGFGGSSSSPIAVGIIEIKVNITAVFRLITFK